jgi:TIR domain
MAFLLPFYDYDAFVSYSHGAHSEGADTPLKDWTLNLVRRLQTDITLDPDFRGLHIWRDEQIDPTIHISDELRGKVSRSGVLMIVMSPLYLESSWCKDELEWFRQQVQDRERDQGRVFIIRAWRTDEKNWPEFLRDTRGHALPGFQFYDRQDGMPYLWRGAETNREAYVQELWRLQGALTKRLRELRDNAERRSKMEAAPAAAPSPVGPRRVYLHARAGQASLCDQVKRALTQRGIAPLSTVADPGRALADWKRESRTRMETAKHCDAMALVRADGDESFVGDLLEIGIDERERIQAERGVPLPCAVLDHSGETLPIDVSGVGIERFDLADDSWSGRFRGWLDQLRAQPPVAAT